MAYQGRKVFVAGSVLTASDLNSTVDQTVMVFASATARNTEIPTPTEGMVVWLSDVNKFFYYTGAAWAALAPNATDIPTTYQTKSANYPIVATDANTFISVTSAATITINDVLTAGQSINFIQTGLGQITFAAGAGVTLSSKLGYLKTNGQFSGATVVRSTTSGQYFLIGDITT